MRRLAPCLACAALAVIAAAPAHGAQKRVYVVSEARGFVHDSIPAAVAYLEQLGRRSPRYDVIPLRGAAGLTPRRLARADAVVFANTTGDLPLPNRAAFLGFVRRGGGFVGTHSAADTLHGWPAYAGMLGAEFKHHPDQQTGRMVLEDRRHPITRGLPRTFAIHDEFYEFTRPPRRRVHVLAHLDPTSITGATGPDHPLVWTRHYGRGRVFYDGLGHFIATWSNPIQRRLVSRGLAWALGLTSASGGGVGRDRAVARAGPLDRGGQLLEVLVAQFERGSWDPTVHLLG